MPGLKLGSARKWHILAVWPYLRQIWHWKLAKRPPRARSQPREHRAPPRKLKGVKLVGNEYGAAPEV